MDMEKMFKVTVDGQEREYASQTPLIEIAKEFEDKYPHRIILALVDGTLKELFYKIEKNCTISFITTAESSGHSAYERTVTFVLLKAIFDTTGKKNLDKTTVRFPIDNGLYFTMEDQSFVSREFIDRVKKRMHEIVEQDIPINKRTISTDDAIRLFHRHHMYDKERLFRYRLKSSVNIYSIGSFDDYFYGFMAPSTGYVPLFDLNLYDDGFVLNMPQAADPETLNEPMPLNKIFRVRKDSGEWGKKLQVSTVGDLNDRITHEGIQSIMLIQEALHEAKISSIAKTIAERGNIRFVMIAGPSSSGKTSFSHRLSVQLAANGLKPHPIAVDNYFVNRANTPLDENGEKDYECLEAIDVEGFNRDMLDLLDGKRVELPIYNFISGEREYHGDFLELGKDDVLVIEGIHGLNDALSYAIPAESKYRIYVSALTQLNIDEHNRISTTDGRLLRRIVRDARTRGNSAQDTIHRWSSVRRGEEKYIFSHREKADVMFNSALVYELACLKVYAEPLLWGVDRDSPEYMEAKRLLKFLDYFLPVPGDEVPNNSLLREFIGGSIFNV